MKKFILALIVITTCFAANAQEPEKKKETKSGTRGQERAINESGVSVKTEPKKSTKAKSAPTTGTAPNESKPAEQKMEAKKPE